MHRHHGERPAAAPRRACCLALALIALGCGGPADRPGGAQTLVYWRTLTGAAGDAQDTLADRFSAQYPDTPVVAHFQGGYSDLATKLITAAPSGTGPDITQLGTFEILEFARRGLLTDLRPYIEGPEGLDTADWPPSLPAAGEVDGGIYWLPFNVTVPVLYYNRDAFEEAGLAGPPETWDEFFDYARRLTVRDERGRVRRTGVAFWNITWPFISMIWSEGGELTDRDYENVTLNHPVAVEVMRRVQALVRDGCASLPDKASGGHRAAFRSGRAAMILDSPAGYRELIEQSAGFTPAAAPYPAGRAGRVYAPGGGGLAMPARVPPERRAAAWRFIRHMLSTESLAYYARETGYLAFTQSARDRAGIAGDPQLALLHEALPYVRGDFSVNMAPAVRTAFDHAFQAIVTDLVDVQAALDAADAEAEAGLRRGLFAP